jgi:hypothetical protein
MDIAMMRPTILIVALMVVTVVVFASTMSSVQSVNATLEILVSVTVGVNGKRLIIVNTIFPQIVSSLE